VRLPLKWSSATHPILSSLTPACRSLWELFTPVAPFTQERVRRELVTTSTSKNKQECLGAISLSISEGQVRALTLTNSPGLRNYFSLITCKIFMRRNSGAL
jgi:hypothetical protein